MNECSKADATLVTLTLPSSYTTGTSREQRSWLWRLAWFGVSCSSTSGLLTQAGTTLLSGRGRNEDSLWQSLRLWSPWSFSFPSLRVMLFGYQIWCMLWKKTIRFCRVWWSKLPLSRSCPTSWPGLWPSLSLGSSYTSFKWIIIAASARSSSTRILS